MKRKVLFIINSMTKGGAERVISNISNYLVEKKYDVSILTLNKDKCDYDLSPYIKLDTLYTNQSKNKKIISKINNIKKMNAYLKNNKPDIVISFLPRASYYSSLLCKKNKIKLIISERNDPKSKYHNKILKLITKQLYARADGLVFQTKDAQQFFQKSIIKKSVIIANPINDKFLKTKISDKRQKKIVAVGRITEQKNHKLIIDAYKELDNKLKDYKLIIYGEGNLKTKIEKYICENNLSENIKLPGIVDDIISEIKDSSLFILSSNYEGMPNALMEAMALGIPCISTDCPCGGPRALINNKENGLLINVGDKKELIDSISYLLNNSKNAEIMANKAKKKMQNYSCKNINKKWKDYIEFTLKNK